MSAAERVVPLHVAMITAEVEAVTGAVLTGKLVPEAPAGTVTVAGTAATEGVALESARITPPAGAGPVSVTVACDVSPPMTAAGSTLTAPRAGGSTVSVAIRRRLP